jgi:hypothetical protein
MNILAVPPSLTRQAWPRAEHYIRSAMDRNEFQDWKQYRDFVFNGQAILWLAVEGTDVQGAALTQKFTQAGKSVCEIVAYGSKDHARCTQKMKEAIEAFGRAEGCSCIRLFGRRGWAKYLKDYRLTTVILEKAL